MKKTRWMRPQNPNAAIGPTPVRAEPRTTPRTDPFDGAKRELYRLAAFWEPENAAQAVEALGSAAEFVDRLSYAFDQIGWNINDTVWFQESVQEYLEHLGAYLRPAADDCHAAHEAVKRAHAADLERIEENDPRKRKWDQAAHDD